MWCVCSILKRQIQRLLIELLLDASHQSVSASVEITNVILATKMNFWLAMRLFLYYSLSRA